MCHVAYSHGRSWKCKCVAEASFTRVWACPHARRTAQATSVQAEAQTQALQAAADGMEALTALQRRPRRPDNIPEDFVDSTTFLVDSTTFPEISSARQHFSCRFGNLFLFPVKLKMSSTRQKCRVDDISRNLLDSTTFPFWREN